MDMASALDISLAAEQEAKFQALKNLQLMKLKALMNSLAAKDKKMAEIVAINKENRRTQMIEALKSKVRDYELVVDVVKKELVSKTSMNEETVNKLIIEKTISGPKRFRPATREELENKVIELEKRKSGVGIGSGGSIADAKSVVSHASAARSIKSSVGVAKTLLPQVHATKSQSTTAVSNAGDLNRMAHLAHEADSLRIALDAAHSTIESLKEEVSRTRARNAELCALEEETDFHESQYQELQQRFDLLKDEMADATRKLAATMEENMQLHAKTMFSQEQVEVERDSLHDECERLLRQNTSLLQRLAEMEMIVDEKSSTIKVVQTKSVSEESKAQAKTAALSTMEQQIVKLKDKLKASDAKCNSMAADLTQVQSLKETLREKNVTIRDLQRIIEDKDKSKQAGGKSGPTSDAKDEVADLKAENKRLKQQLQLALSSASAAPKPSSSAGRSSSKATDDKEISGHISPELLSLLNELMVYATGILKVTAPATPPTSLVTAAERMQSVGLQPTLSGPSSDKFTAALGDLCHALLQPTP